MVWFMPSQVHESFAEVFRREPGLVAQVLSGLFGLAVPAFQQAQLSSGELTEVVPAEYRADAVVVLTAGAANALAVVVEVQLRTDQHKQWTWPVYLVNLRARLKCPVVLLVMCRHARTAAWCARPIAIGHPGLVLTPLVLGPNQVPVLTDPDAARDSPELAVLSAMIHGARPGTEAVLEALLAGLETLDHDHADLYTDLVLTVLPKAARDCLEALMTTTGYRYKSDFARRHFDRGRAEGEARGRAEGEATAAPKAKPKRCWRFWTPARSRCPTRHERRSPTAPTSTSSRSGSGVPSRPTRSTSCSTE